MECVVKCPIMYNSSEIVQKIRQYYGLDKPENMNQAVAILEDWIRKQTHFRKKNFNRIFLEMLIIQSKGSVERAKSRLDNNCTLRTMLPRFFEKNHPKTDLNDMHETFYTFVLPRFVGDYYRVCMIKAYERNITSNKIMDFYKLSLSMVEYALANDYFNGIIVIFDYSEVDMSKILMAMSPTDLREILKLHLECFGIRLRGIHFVTPSALIQSLVALIRQFLSEKLSQRVHVHKNLDSLFQMLPREQFPKEYGGNEKSLVSIRDDWIELLASEEFRKYNDEMKEATTNEEKRDNYEFNSKYLGQPGTFRYMNLD